MAVNQQIVREASARNIVENISSQLATRISQSRLELPMLPKVAGAVIFMTQDESADMAGLAQLIQQDQALATRVMKISNSPAYRGLSPMNSLQQAIARMGMKTISEMALAASVGAKVFNVGNFSSEASRFWQHSVAAAGWAKEIARIRRRNVESAFMCGLLHQIGKPVALQAIVDISESIGVQPCTEDLQLLIRQFHTSVGLSLGRSWELPPMVIESIEFQDNYAAAPQFSREVMIAAGGHFLADQLLGDAEMNLAEIADCQVMEDLNLYEDDVETLLELKDSVRSMVEVMGV